MYVGILSLVAACDAPPLPNDATRSLTEPSQRQSAAAVAAWLSSHRLAQESAAPKASSLLEAQEREIARAFHDVLLIPAIRERLSHVAKASRDFERKVSLTSLIADASFRPLVDRLKRADSRRHLAPEFASSLPLANLGGGCDPHAIICDDGSVNPNLPPMDVYMPIDDHRDTWNGTQPVITVPIVSEDQPWVLATGPNGEGLWVHIDSVPPLHTMVVTPVERTAEVWATGPLGARTWQRSGQVQESISHVRSILPYEPRLLGRPEFKLILSTGFTCVQGPLGCKWKANKSFERFLTIPSGTWPRRPITGAGWNAAWRQIEGGSKLLIDWQTAPAPLFTPFLGARSPVMISCVEEDADLSFKGKPKRKNVISLGAVWAVGFEADVDHKDADDDCGLHMMFPPGNGTRPAIAPSISVAIPSNETDFAETQGGFGWFGFGVPRP